MKKIGTYISLFNSALMGVLFTAVGTMIGGSIVWRDIAIQVVVSLIAGFVIGIVIPADRWGGKIAEKVAKPGTVLYKFIMYSVILAVMLTCMCPILAVFMGCIVNGAPLSVALTGCYQLVIPFYCVGITTLVLVGDRVIAIATKCAELTEVK